MKRAIVLVLALAAAFGCGIWWAQNHSVTPAPATEKPQAEEGVKVTHDEHGNTVIAMGDDDKAKAGIVFAKPVAGQWIPETKGYGRVVDPAPLAELVNELISAQATARVSEQEWERQKTLTGQSNTSARALQTAEAAARHDQIAIQAVRDKLAAAWGTALAGREDLQEFVQSLIARQAVLVRVDLPAGEMLEPPPPDARLVTLSDKTIHAKYVGPVADIDPQVQGQGFIFVVPNSDSLAPGAAVTAWLQAPGKPLNGVIIPRDSVVRLEGSGWVYVMNKGKGGEAFTRTGISLDRPTENGWFVTDTVKADEYIVITGAQLLLSEELKAALSPD